MSVYVPFAFSKLFELTNPRLSSYAHGAKQFYLDIQEADGPKKTVLASNKPL